MKVPWRRPVLIAIASCAAAFPLRIQLDFGHGSSLPILNEAALAKGGGDSGNNGGGNGNGGNSGGKGDSGNGNGGAGGQGNGGANGNNGGGGSKGGPGDSGGNAGGQGNAGSSGNGSNGGKGNSGGNAGSQGNAGTNGNGNSRGGNDSGATGNGGGKSNGSSGGNAGNGNGNGGSSGKGNSNGGGIGGGASRGNSGGTGGGLGRGNSAGDVSGTNVGRGNSVGGGVDASAGAGKGNSPSSGNGGTANPGNGGKAGSSTGVSAGAGGSKANPQAGGLGVGNASSGKSPQANDRTQRNNGKAPASRSKAAVASPERPGQVKAAARPQAAKAAQPVKARPRQVIPVVEEIDRRPKPRRSTRSIVASGLSQEDLDRLTAEGFRVEARTRGSIAPQVIRLQVPAGLSVARARELVRLADARALVDFDQFYYLDEHHAACTGAECQVPSPVNWASLVNWSDADTPRCGPAPLIGLIDTGVNVEHAALKGQAVEVISLPERRAMASLQDHGTAVAALLVGRPTSQTPGLLPGARIVAVDAFYRDGGTADRTDVMTLVAAIEALAERGVRVMNMSLSGPSNEVLQKAIAAAQAKGIVIVAAAGNNGAGAEPSYPAAYPGVVAVTAIDNDLNVYRRATRGPYVDLSAPGVNVWTASAKGSAMLRTGTSYAVPFVSAAASLVLAWNPALDAKAVQSQLEAHTRDLGQPGRDPTFGVGLIQMSGLCKQPVEAPTVASGPEPSSAASYQEQFVDIP
ncbi:MAG TPA: S8 family serine peptidase [Microvirga sp.]|jgi:hypothetical protein|nr:S8 family serine peptidase [Microvirga sp.]